MIFWVALSYKRLYREIEGQIGLEAVFDRKS